MIRINVKYHLLIILVFGLLPFSSNADSLKKGDKNNLVNIIQIASTLNSAIWVTYIGKTKERLYVEYGTVAHVGSLFTKEPSYTIYWFPVTMITNHQLEILRNSKRDEK